MAAALSDADAWLRPFDRARTALFVRALRVSALRGVLLEKRRRIPALLLLHASAAFVLSVLAPTLLLVVGPLLLGVPHLVADLRYLALRPLWPKRVRALLLGGSLLLLALAFAQLLGFRGLSRYELPLAALWVTGAVAASPGRRGGRLCLVACGAAAFASAAWLAPGALRLVMAHAHNVIAVGLWAFAFRRAGREALAVAFVLAFATLLLLATPLAWFGFQHGWRESLGLHVFVAAEQLAPFARSTPFALGVVASFAFLQSVHYAVWLHAIPQEATRGEGTLSFRMSFHALKGELGAAGLAVVVVLVVLLGGFGLMAPLRAQATYLSLAPFHGYLELAVLSLWWVQGRSGR